MFVNGQGTALPPSKFLHPQGKSHASLKNELCFFFLNELFFSKKYHVGPNTRKAGVSSPPRLVFSKETEGLCGLQCACGLCHQDTAGASNQGPPPHPQPQSLWEEVGLRIPSPRHEFQWHPCPQSPDLEFFSSACIYSLI